MKKIKMFIQRSLNFFKKNTTTQLIKKPNLGLTHQATFLLKIHNPFRSIYSLIVLLLLISTTFNSFGQSTLKMGTSGGPAGSGPTTSSRTVTLTENGTSTFTPTVTATYSLSNQQYPSGTVNGTSQVGLTFGGSTNNGGSMGSWPYYPLMNNIGSANNTMFSACSTCGANSGINVSSDKAISLFTSANALITSSSTNKVALNARVYFGDLTITFNRPVTNPVLHFIGMGAFYEHSGNSSDKVYFQGFSAEFDLASSGMSLSKLDGSTYFTVASNQIRNTASQLSYSSVGVVQYGVSRHGASGSVLVTGTNITTY